MKNYFIKLIGIVAISSFALFANAAWTQDGNTATDGVWTLKISVKDGVVRITGQDGGSGVLDLSTLATDLGCTGVIVGNDAFRNNTNITGLVLPGDLVEICDSAFESCSNLTGEIATTAAFTMSGYNLFDKTAITSVNFPNMTGSVASWAFYECKQLKTVTLGEGVTYFGTYSFFTCSALETIQPSSFPNVTGVGEKAFQYCRALTSSLSLPSAMQINHLAFEGVACEEISLPACTNLSGACFYESKVKKITHSPDVQLNGDVFYKSTELEELVPGRFRALSGLSGGVFQECNSLKKLDFTGSTFTSLSYNSVKWLYNMEYLVLPETLGSLGDWSFERIKKADVVFSGPKPTIGGSNVFAHNSDDKKLRINIISPKEHIASWTNANSGVTFTPLAEVDNSQKTAEYQFPTSGVGHVVGTVNFGNSLHWMSVLNEPCTIILVQ